jgi:hypothetical protein
LPTLGTGPRIITQDQTAQTGIGLQMQAEQLLAECKKAANSLLTVAVIQTIAPVIILVLISSVERPEAADNIFSNVFFIILFGIAALFWGLYIWSRKAPLPATLAGLIIYVTLKVIDFVSIGVMVANAPPSSGNSGGGSSAPVGGSIGGIWVTVFIIMMLIRGVKAGLRHRELLKQQQSTEAAVA